MTKHQRWATLSLWEFAMLPVSSHVDIRTCRSIRCTLVGVLCAVGRDDVALGSRTVRAGGKIPLANEIHGDEYGCVVGSHEGSHADGFGIRLIGRAGAEELAGANDTLSPPVVRVALVRKIGRIVTQR